jgi:hypothetical protein
MHKSRIFRSTARASYRRRMTFEVRFSDERTTVVEGADAYEQEGPLTTFFERNGGGRLASAFSVRVASFRTDRLVEIRRCEQVADLALVGGDAFSATA